MTPAERVFWQHLRANRLEGWHFRRQQVIAGFIVDFYCHAAALVVEVDGDVHEGQVEVDARRDQILEDMGFLVFRYKNKMVMEQLTEVLDQISKACRAQAPRYDLSPLIKDEPGKSSELESNSISPPLLAEGLERKLPGESNTESPPLLAVGFERKFPAESKIDSPPLKGEGLGERSKKEPHL